MAITLGTLVREGAPLTVGDSNFTLFIAPFRYRLQGAQPTSRGAAHYYELHEGPGPARFAQRFNYLTGETREIIFGSSADGARIFSRLEREVSEYRLSETIHLHWYAYDAQSFDLDADVRLVLFDQRSARQRLPAHRDCGCIGFLIVKVAAVQAMTWDHFLDLNAHFRLLRYEYPDQRQRLLKRNADRPLPEGAIRYPGFDVTLPDAARAGDPAVDPDPLAVDFWARLLHCPIGFASGTKRLDADLSAHADQRVFVASHGCAGGAPWSVREGGELWTLWHQILHVEPQMNPRRGALVEYENRWARERTYFRWTTDGRLWGFSGYSFCSLCEPSDFYHPLLHFEDMYLDMLLLVLYQRTAVFSYGRELSHLSQGWKRRGWSSARRPLTELRASFNQFVNLYWFPVFTYQLQGIEMYEIARRELDNLELFEELRTEMEGTWSFMEARYAERLNRGGMLAVALGLILGFLGMSIVSVKKGAAEVFPVSAAVWVYLVLFLLLALLLYHVCVQRDGGRR